jgi:hypothetical protein
VGEVLGQPVLDERHPDRATGDTSPTTAHEDAALVGLDDAPCVHVGDFTHAEPPVLATGDGDGGHRSGLRDRLAIHQPVRGGRFVVTTGPKAA